MWLIDMGYTDDQLLAEIRSRITLLEKKINVLDQEINSILRFIRRIIRLIVLYTILKWE